MKSNLLSLDEILSGYDAVSQLYPYLPSMNMWRAWEYAAYQNYELAEPVLDVGCGDGRFFRLLWPDVSNVVGIDMDASVVDVARGSGVYREVHATPAHQLPVQSGSFASAFANCSLEHMDHLPEVLNGISRSLRPGGSFLCSVITDKWHAWRTLSLLLESIGDLDRARALQAEYIHYHHHVNASSPEEWQTHLEQAGFRVLEHIPIVPELTSRLFLFIDHLWHVRRGSNELGDILSPYLESIPDVPKAFRAILDGILQMERDWSTGSGAVFLAQKKG